MAVVRTPDDRAQLLIIAAVGLAILLALMTLVLNTAVFGEVHVAQTAESLTQERGAVEYLTAAEQAVGGLLPSINAAYNSPGDLEVELQEDIETWENLSRPEYERDGVTTAVSLEGVAYETTILQDVDGTFEAANGNSTWTVAENVAAVRDVEMNVSVDGLAQLNDCTDAGDGCFEFAVNDTWRLFLYNDSGGIEVAVDNSSGSIEQLCDPDIKSVSINVTAGTFAGDGCDDFTSFVDDGAVVSPYTLRYANASKVTGTYEVTVEGLVEDDDRYADDGGSPRLAARIDRVDLGVRYRSVRLDYETEIRVEPGETDG